MEQTVSEVEAVRIHIIHSIWVDFLVDCAILLPDMNTSTVPFDGRVNYFTVPSGLSHDEKRIFVETAHVVDSRLAQESGESAEIHLAKATVGERVIHAITTLCRRAGYDVAERSDSREWILDFRFA